MTIKNVCNMPYERFIAKVNKMAPNGCWEWTASCSSNGYGQFSDSGANFLAHRWSYEWFVGPIPPGMCVCHLCDNPRCVNPEHLWLGTHKENMIDMVAKGRNASGDRNGSRTHPEKLTRGEKVNTAKLTAEIVRQARKEYASGKFTYQQLADKYEVALTPMYFAIQRRTWKHVTQEGRDVH